MSKLLILVFWVSTSVTAKAQDFERVLSNAQSGNAHSQYAVGNLYETQQNFAKAMHWYTLAANQGITQAQFQLGLIYEEGREGILPNLPYAISWYEEAARNGYRKAIEKLKHLK